MDDFESFTREKITRLRAEADAMEKTLKEYLSTRARKEGAAKRSGGDNPRGGAFGVIMDALAAAGDDGLTLDQMIDAAAQEGFEVKRNTLRSQIWTAKNDREVEQIGTGHYRVARSNLDRFVERAGDAFSQAAAALERGATQAAQREAGGFSSRPARAPREDFSASLDDEIPF